MPAVNLPSPAGADPRYNSHSDLPTDSHIDSCGTGGQVSRRDVLLSSIAAAPFVLMGCGLQVGQPTGLAEQTAKTTADDLARKRVSVSAQSLARTLRAAANQHPQYASRLLSLATEHNAHSTALLPAKTSSKIPSTESAPAAGIPTTSREITPGKTSPSASSDPTPAKQTLGKEKLILLASAERAAAAIVVNDIATASPTVARLLASIRASRLMHATLLISWADGVDS